MSTIGVLSRRGDGDVGRVAAGGDVLVGTGGRVLFLDVPIGSSVCLDGVVRIVPPVPPAATHSSSSISSHSSGGGGGGGGGLPFMILDIPTGGGDDDFIDDDPSSDLPGDDDDKEEEGAPPLPAETIAASFEFDEERKPQLTGDDNLAAPFPGQQYDVASFQGHGDDEGGLEDDDEDDEQAPSPRQK